MHLRSLKLTVAVVAFLSLAVVIACGGSYSAPTTPAAPPAGGGGTGSADVTVTIVGMNGNQSFSPNPVTVKVGQTVAWHNADSTTHTATADAGAFDAGAIAPGSTSNAITMSVAGTFGYHCSIHPTMVGTITVTQ